MCLAEGLTAFTWRYSSVTGQWKRLLRHRLSIDSYAGTRNLRLCVGWLVSIRRLITNSVPRKQVGQECKAGCAGGRTQVRVTTSPIRDGPNSIFALFKRVSSTRSLILQVMEVMAIDQV
jgi:hypothetical protein